jgi:hypothetical protein
MCTAVLHWNPSGALAVMNRDERRDRAEEIPPGPFEFGGVRGLAPRDSERGGTWIGVNERGVMAFLLNGYVPGDLELVGRAGIPSRGSIVPALLAHDADGARDHLQRHFDPSPYPSFTVVLAAPDGAMVSRWRLDGTWDHDVLPLGWNLMTSSAWRTDEVCAWRTERFDEWRSNGAPMNGAIPSYLLLEIPERREWSPMMSRSWSATRSVTRATVTPAERMATMSYWRRTDSGFAVEHPEATVDLALSTPVEAA